MNRQQTSIRTARRAPRGACRTGRRRAAVIGGALVALVALLATGCGGSSGETAATTAAKSGGLTTVRVGVLAIGTQAPIYLGIKRGFFRDEGLRLKLHVAGSGSAIVPAVMRGSDQFGFANGASVVFGAATGLPIEVVAGGEGAATRGHRDQDLSSLMVAKGSSIRTPKDLEGKTIAVSALRDAPELLTRAALANEGVDVSKVSFQEVPYPEMLAALHKGQVDAAYLVTPFAEQAAAAGDRLIIRPYYDTHPGLVTAYYFTSTKFAQEHPDTVGAFQRALLKSMRYANAHPDKARKLLPTFTKIPSEIVPEVSFGHYPTTLAQARGSLARLASLMVSYGFVKSRPDTAKLVFDASRGQG